MMDGILGLFGLGYTNVRYPDIQKECNEFLVTHYYRLGKSPNILFDAANKLSGPAQLAVIKILCNSLHKYDINQQDEDGNTVLHIIIRSLPPLFGRLRDDMAGWFKADLDNIRQIIFQLKPDIYIQNKWGNTIFHELVQIGDAYYRMSDKMKSHAVEPAVNTIPVLLDFIEKRMDNRVSLSPLDKLKKMTNVDGNTLLHLAAACGQDQTVKLLLEKGWEVNRQNNDGITPMHYAALGQSANHVNVTSLLLRVNRIDINIEHKMIGTPFDIAHALATTGIIHTNKNGIEETIQLDPAKKKVAHDIKELLAKHKNFKLKEHSLERELNLENVFCTIAGDEPHAFGFLNIAIRHQRECNSKPLEENEKGGGLTKTIKRLL